jgi:hypothetical protein
VSFTIGADATTGVHGSASLSSSLPASRVDCLEAKQFAANRVPVKRIVWLPNKRLPDGGLTK